MRRLRQAGALALLAATLGCPAGGLRTGRPLSTALLERVAPARTTKAELFALLGAPVAIAAADEVVLVPANPVRATVEGKRSSEFLDGGTYPIQGNALHALFDGARTARGELRVYHYLSARERGFFFIFPVFFGAEHYTNRVDELYVLVDEETERVEGVVFRPGGGGVSGSP